MNRRGRDLLDDLKGRGVKTIDAVRSVMAIKPCWAPSPSSFRIRFANAAWYTKWTMCESLVPSKQQDQLKPELKALFYQKDRQAADQAVAAFIEKYRAVYPTAVACLQRDLEACLTFYATPSEHWKTIRTTTVSERLEGSVKRRSHKMAAAFRNEESCVLLFYAVIPASQVQETDDE